MGRRAANAPDPGTVAGPGVASQLDHLVLAVPDLDAGIAWLRQLTGVEARPGGAHPGMGTRNALVALRDGVGGAAYLELLGPDPDQSGVAADDTMLGFGHLVGDDESTPDFVPRLHAWAVRPDDLDATVAQATAAGIEVGVPAGASRRTTAGTLLRWRLAVPRPLGLGGVQPFLIDWGGGAHPTDDDLPTLTLTGLELVHPDTERSGQTLALLGVDRPVAPGPVPRLRATVDGPAGPARL